MVGVLLLVCAPRVATADAACLSNGWMPLFLPDRESGGRFFWAFPRRGGQLGALSGLLGFALRSMGIATPIESPPVAARVPGSEAPLVSGGRDATPPRLLAMVSRGGPADSESNRGNP